MEKSVSPCRHGAPQPLTVAAEAAAAEQLQQALVPTLRLGAAAQVELKATIGSSVPYYSFKRYIGALSSWVSYSQHPPPHLGRSHVRRPRLRR
jgi:hypothetical protein